MQDTDKVEQENIGEPSSAGVANFIKYVKVRLPSLAWGVVWIYGSLILMALAVSLVVPEGVAAWVVGFFASGFGEAIVNMGWWGITLNNSLVLMLYLVTPYNLSLPFTGFVVGCIFGMNNIKGANLLPIIIPQLLEPFAILELGAYVLAASLSYHRLKQGKISGKAFLVVALASFLMLTVAGYLEWMLIIQM